MKEPSYSDNRKAQKEAQMRRAEAEYLRFLRTKERPDNFATLKIIGKGAFGEVKLVQRKNDGKIYALKSLVKHEMVTTLAQVVCTALWLTRAVQKRPACPCSLRA